MQPGPRTIGVILGLALLSVTLLPGCSDEPVDAAALAGPVKQEAGKVAQKDAAAGDKLSAREPRRIVLTDCDGEQPACHEVLDCSDTRAPCFTRFVRFDVEACAEAERRDMCQNFEQRLPTVSLVTDSENFVSAPLAEPSVSAEPVAIGIRFPWDLEFLPDGSMLITAKDGAVFHIDNGGQRSKLLELDVIAMGEAGLMGLAIDPDFASNQFIYLAYTHRLDNSDPSFLEPELATMRRIVNRISRFRLSDRALEDELVILDNIPGSYMHTGLRLEFGPDEKLYAGTGDAHIAIASQDPDFLGGKILRLNRDGTVPDDNPIPAVTSIPVAIEMYRVWHGTRKQDSCTRRNMALTGLTNSTG